MRTLPAFLVAFIAVAFGSGCAPIIRQVNFDSEPRGARVFIGTGANEDIAKSGRSFLGVTPFKWSTEVDGDGRFKTEKSGIPIYSDFVQRVVVFTAEPPSGSTNLFIKREVFHGTALFQPGNKAPEGIFFDLTKP